MAAEPPSDPDRVATGTSEAAGVEQPGSGREADAAAPAADLDAAAPGDVPSPGRDEAVPDPQDDVRPESPVGQAEAPGAEATQVAAASAEQPRPVGPAWFEETPPAPRRRPLPEPRTATSFAAPASATFRSRFGSEVIGLVVLGVLAVVCAALIVAVVLKTQGEAASAAREAAAYTPPPLASASPAPTGPVIAVVSDETALRAASGTTAVQRWPQVLGSRLSARVIPFASAGAGYVTAGADGDTFAQVAATVPASSRVVLFVGGGADASTSSLTLARAATQAFSAAAKQAPDATLIAVGPIYAASGADPDDLASLRTALQSAARVAGVRWVDPIRSDWLQGVSGTAGLTPAAERVVAARIQSVVAAATG